MNDCFFKRLVGILKQEPRMVASYLINEKLSIKQDVTCHFFWSNSNKILKKSREGIFIG